jgi:hypothetical protein
MTTTDPAARIIARGLRTSVAALLGLAVVYVLAIGFTPIEARQGVAQKLFYLPVP